MVSNFLSTRRYPFTNGLINNFVICLPCPRIHCSKPWTYEAMPPLHFRAYSLHFMPQLHFYYFLVTPLYTPVTLLSPLISSWLCASITLSAIQSSTCHIGQCEHVSTHTHTHAPHWRAGHLFDGLSPFTSCTVVYASVLYFFAREVVTFAWAVATFTWTVVTSARRMTVSQLQPIHECHNFHPALAKLPMQPRRCFFPSCVPTKGEKPPTFPR